MPRRRTRGRRVPAASQCPARHAAERAGAAGAGVGLGGAGGAGRAPQMPVPVAGTAPAPEPGAPGGGGPKWLTVRNVPATVAPDHATVPVPVDGAGAGGVTCHAALPPLIGADSAGPPARSIETWSASAPPAADAVPASEPSACTAAASDATRNDSGVRANGPRGWIRTTSSARI